jgi:hypothetical protein
MKALIVGSPSGTPIWSGVSAPGFLRRHKTTCLKILDDPSRIRPAYSHVSLAIAYASAKASLDFHHVTKMKLAGLDFSIG